jgi:hypothetical protein
MAFFAYTPILMIQTKDSRLVIPTESVTFATDGQVIVSGTAASELPRHDVICLPTLARTTTADMAGATGFGPNLPTNRRRERAPSVASPLLVSLSADRLDVNGLHETRPSLGSIGVHH